MRTIQDIHSSYRLRQEKLKMRAAYVWFNFRFVECVSNIFFEIPIWNLEKNEMSIL